MSRLDRLSMGSRRWLMRGGIGEIAESGSFLAVHAEDEETTGLHTANLRADGRQAIVMPGASRGRPWRIQGDHRGHLPGGRYRQHARISFTSRVPPGSTYHATPWRGASRMTSETCAHYLFFDETDPRSARPVAKCAPPASGHRGSGRSCGIGFWEGTGRHTSDHSPCLCGREDVGGRPISSRHGGAYRACNRRCRRC